MIALDPDLVDAAAGAAADGSRSASPGPRRFAAERSFGLHDPYGVTYGVDHTGEVLARAARDPSQLVFRTKQAVIKTLENRRTSSQNTQTRCRRRSTAVLPASRRRRGGGAGFGFGTKGKGPSKFYEFDHIKKQTIHRPEVHQLAPH